MVDYIFHNKKMLIKGDNIEDWGKLANILNESKGAVKTSEQWRRSFIEWKSKTKKKARTLAASQQATGGGSNPYDDLTDIECKLVSLIGTTSVYGDSDLVETRVDESTELQSNTDIDKNYESSDVKIASPDNLDPSCSETIVIVNVSKEGEDENNSMPLTNVLHSQASSNEQVKKGVKRKANQQPTYDRKKSILPTALQEYAKSADKFAQSIDKLSASINKLADSNYFLAENISKQNGV